MQSNGINQSMQSLATIMPITIEQLLNDQEDDKYPTPNCKCQRFCHFEFAQKFQDSIIVLINQQDICDQHNMMINSEKTNINTTTVIVDNQTMLPTRSKRKQLSNTSWIKSKCWFLLVLLLIIALGIVIAHSTDQIHHLKAHLQTANERIQQLINQPEDCAANKGKMNAKSYCIRTTLRNQNLRSLFSEMLNNSNFRY
jgi:hypothetical protein